MKFAIDSRKLGDCLAGIDTNEYQQREFEFVFSELHQQIEPMLFLLTSSGWNKSDAMLVLGRLFQQFGDGLVEISKQQKECESVNAA